MPTFAPLGEHAVRVGGLRRRATPRPPPAGGWCRRRAGRGAPRSPVPALPRSSHRRSMFRPITDLESRHLPDEVEAGHAQRGPGGGQQVAPLAGHHARGPEAHQPPAGAQQVVGAAEAAAAQRVEDDVHRRQVRVLVARAPRRRRGRGSRRACPATRSRGPRRPRALAIWVAAIPTAPAAAWMSTRSPGRRVAQARPRGRVVDGNRGALLEGEAARGAARCRRPRPRPARRSRRSASWPSRGRPPRGPRRPARPTPPCPPPRSRRRRAARARRGTGPRGPSCRRS